MRETTVNLIPKEQIDYLKDDKGFIDFIKNEQTRKIADRLIQVLETNDEIIVKKPVLHVDDRKVSEYHATDYVEYRKTVDWEPLVRCKDCKYAMDWDEKTGCELHGFYSIAPDWFCADGERRTDDAETH